MAIRQILSDGEMTGGFGKNDSEHPWKSKAPMQGFKGANPKKIEGLGVKLEVASNSTASRNAWI